MINIKKILIENTTYSLLIYLLIEKKWQETIFILNKKYFPENIFYKISTKAELKQTQLPFKSGDSTLKKVIKYYQEKIYWNIFSFINKKSHLYGNDNLEVSRFFKINSFNILEDGLINYTFIDNSKVQKINLKKLIKLEFKKYKSYGLEENIKKIYLTGLAPIPKEIAHKVEIINLKELWDKKSLEEQNEILDIFSFDLNIKETIKSRDIILFTQPLSEDAVITEEEKIELYSKIIKKYPQDRLIVKTHPREKTNYKEMFKDNLVLDNPFPFEILNLLDVKFNKAVTIFSTAALGLGKDVAVDFYGTEVNDKILARFGSCENIMKRNTYLEEEE